jgi:hypothetical protein
MKLGQKKVVHFLKTASKSNSRYLQRQLRHQKQAKQTQLGKRDAQGFDSGLAGIILAPVVV